jgi:hypothetical protein
MKKAQAEIIKRSKPAIVKEIKKIYSHAFGVRKVNLSKLKVENIDFYTECDQYLKSIGFAWVADFKVISLPKGSSGYKTPISVYISKEQTAYCGIYSVQLSNEEKMNQLLLGTLAPMNIVDVTSRINGGIYLSTTNAEVTKLQTKPKRIQSEILKLRTKVDRIVKAHYARLRVVSKAGKKLNKFISFEDIVENERQMHEVKTEFQKKRGWASKAEIKRQHDDVVEKEDNMEKLLRTLEKAFLG